MPKQCEKSTLPSSKTIREIRRQITCETTPKKPLGIPADTEWKDLRAFHRAVLSAHQVKCEFAVFLIDLWDAIWQPALNSCNFGTKLEPFNVAAAEEWDGQKLDTNTVWDQGRFFRVFDISGKSLQLEPGVFVDAEQVRLSLCLLGSDETDHTTGRDFGGDWPEKEIEDNFAWTSKNLAPIRDDGTIDLAPLHKAAADAAAAVPSHISD